MDPKILRTWPELTAIDPVSEDADIQAPLYAGLFFKDWASKSQQRISATTAAMKGLTASLLLLAATAAYAQDYSPP